MARPLLTMWLSVCVVGMDTGKQRAVDCVARQPAPASVRGKAGEDPQVYDQRESTQPTGSG